MTRETCLKRHLLFASVEAYHPHPPLYSAPARWTEGPREIDVPRIDFALVGRFAEGIVVAFRGTLTPVDLTPDGRAPGPLNFRDFGVWSDWVNSLLHALPVHAVVAGEALPGRVHGGFAESLDGLWAGIADEVDRLRAGEPAPRIYFTGHSKGGALANLAAVRAHRAWPLATVRTVTFGGPRVGDAAFAQAYLAAGIVGHRYEVGEDIVPDVPPGNVAVGTPHDVAEIRYPLGDFRWLLRGPVGAHLPYRGFGYGENVCEPGCTHDWR